MWAHSNLASSSAFLRLAESLHHACDVAALQELAGDECWKDYPDHVNEELERLFSTRGGHYEWRVQEDDFPFESFYRLWPTYGYQECGVTGHRHEMRRIEIFFPEEID